MSDVELSKRHDTDLWREIRKLYESKAKPSYEKIKTILMAECALDKFPSESTVKRRAKSEEWIRARTSEEVPDANRFGDDFWECVRAIYESNPKMTHRQLKDLVQNELQISDFPTHQALAKRAKLEGWEHADEALKKSDLTLQKQANCIKIKIKQQKIIDKNNDNNQFDDYVEDDYAAHIRKIVEAEETRFKNVTMNANIRTQKLAEVIIKSRKRMRTINEIGDLLSDELIGIGAIMSSQEFLKICPPHVYELYAAQERALMRAMSAYTQLTESRRESIKFELSLYGVQMEDLRDNDNESRMKDLNDDAAYEKQKQRLLDECIMLAKRRAFIDSGGLQREVDAEMQRRMDEMNEYDDVDSVEDDEYSGIE